MEEERARLTAMSNKELKAACASHKIDVAGQCTTPPSFLLLPP